MSKGISNINSLVKVRVFSEALEKMVDHNLVFADELAGFIIQDLEDHIGVKRSTTMKIFDCVEKRTIGVIDFQDSRYVHSNPMSKIHWKIYVTTLEDEKKALIVRTAIQKVYKKINVKIIANS